MKNRGLALGIIETVGFPPLIAAADAAAKAADVHVAAYEGADAGIVTVYIAGDVSSVQAAISVGEAAARSVGHCRGAHVIARPDASVYKLFPALRERNANPAVKVPAGGKSESDSESNVDQQTDQGAATSGDHAGDAAILRSKPIGELRQLARSYATFPLSGRQIATVGKDELVRHLLEAIAEYGKR